MVLVALTVAVAACGRPVDPSSERSVDIPQTAIKAQNKIGFCWAYATTGFLESLLLKKSGQAVDLSEEAIGFYRMAEELKALSLTYSAAELADGKMVAEKTFEGLEGWDLTFNPVYNPQFPARNALQLVHDYGVVPESVWSYKFLSQDQTEAFFTYVFTKFAALMQANGQEHVTMDMIFDLLASPEAYGSRPPASFTYVLPNGQQSTMTAQEFAANVIGFSPDDYTYMIPDQQIGYDKLVTAVKETLARGIDVPLSFNIYEGSENRWDASFSAKTLDPSDLELDGGHAVLVTDFVNKNGQPGALPTAALSAEMSKPASELDFVVIKNSWDTSVQSPLLRLPGYFTMDQGYLQLLARSQEDVAIVVPRDIAFRVRYDR
jgi:hypothetical protein